MDSHSSVARSAIGRSQGLSGRGSSGQCLLSMLVWRLRADRQFVHRRIDRRLTFCNDGVQLARADVDRHRPRLLDRVQS